MPNRGTRRLRYSRIWSKSRTANRSQLSIMARIMYTWEKTLCFFRKSPIQNRSSRISRNWNIPHTMKLRLLPCQIPVASHTARLLKSQRAVPFRLPPRGM